MRNNPPKASRSQALGKLGREAEARDRAYRAVASYNPPSGGYSLPDLGRPPEDYQRGGRRYRGSLGHREDVAVAILRGCDPRTEDCPPGTPSPTRSRRRCRPCRGRRCRR